MKKKVFCTIVLILAVLTVQAQMNIKVSTGRIFRQDTVDYKVLTVQYDMEALIDLSKPDEPVKETMRLDIGRKSSRFYSYTAFLLDSVLAVDVANGASTELMARHAKQYQSLWSEQTFKRYPDGKTTTLDEIAGEIARLRCEEEKEEPLWTLSQDTLTILGYRCFLATTDFKGRRWSAWFTPDIPVSEGPWKLAGLPGLVLKAEDEEGHYLFTANGIEQCRETVPILFNGTDYEPVNRKQYAKVHERYFTDPIGFITSTMPNVKVTVKDKHGNPTQDVRDMPYNPIER